MKNNFEKNMNEDIQNLIAEIRNTGISDEKQITAGKIADEISDNGYGKIDEHGIIHLK